MRELYPQARSYLDVYRSFGLLRERAVYAHCIHLDEPDRQLLRDSGAAAAVSPTSNLFLGSGFFDFAGAQRVGFLHGLASDVGGGTSFSPFHTMLAAYFVGREGETKQGLSLQPSHLWWLHTGGAARALGLEGVIGTLQAGTEADFVLLNPRATPLLARKTERAQNLEELLFADRAGRRPGGRADGDCLNKGPPEALTRPVHAARGAGSDGRLRRRLGGSRINSAKITNQTNDQLAMVPPRSVSPPRCSRPRP